MIETLTLEHFTPHIGTEFVCRTPDGGTYPLRLNEAVAAGEQGRKVPGKEELRSPFSLLFLGPESPVLPQSIYPLEHTELGTLPLFIVPVGKEGGGILYQAVFN
jgi:hypothetical protein